MARSCFCVVIFVPFFDSTFTPETRCSPNACFDCLVAQLRQDLADFAIQDLLKLDGRFKADQSGRQLYRAAKKIPPHNAYQVDHLIAHEVGVD